MAPRKSLNIIFIAGIFLMFSGVVGGALMYREMRAQRVLHEAVHLFRFDPSTSSPWMTATLPVYQDGPHAVMLALSGPDDTPAQYHGAIVVTVEDPGGVTILNARVSSFGEGIVVPGRVWWFPLDTLVVKTISPGDWRMQVRLLSGDPKFAGSPGELVILPPGQGEFTPYLQNNAYKLYGAGPCLVMGFLVVVFGGRKSVQGKNI